jgi:hypothetical protein
MWEGHHRCQFQSNEHQIVWMWKGRLSPQRQMGGHHHALSWIFHSLGIHSQKSTGGYLYRAEWLLAGQVCQLSLMAEGHLDTNQDGQGQGVRQVLCSLLGEEDKTGVPLAWRGSADHRDEKHLVWHVPSRQ